MAQQQSSEWDRAKPVTASEWDQAKPVGGQQPPEWAQRVLDTARDLTQGTGAPKRQPGPIEGLLRTATGSLDKAATGKGMRELAGLAVGGAGGALAKTAALKLLPRGLQTIGNIAGQAGAGAAGAAVTGDDPTMAAGLGGGITAAGAVAQGLARPLMRGAHRVTANIGRKHGGAIEEAALKHRIMPTDAGAEKAAGLRNAAMAEQDAAVAAAGSQPSIVPRTLAKRAETALAPDIADDIRSGIPNAAVPDRVAHFGAQPAMTPSELHGTRRVWNRDIGKAFIKNKAGEPMDLEEKALKSLLGESTDVLETAAPGYGARNKNISILEGLRQSAQGAADVPGTGMDDLFMGYGMAVDPAASPALATVRALKSRPVRGGLAIGMNEAGKIGDNPYIRAALLQALLGGSQEPD
jgi:hypothetical protein